jgi:hypothetical protein
MNRSQGVSSIYSQSEKIEDSFTKVIDRWDQILTQRKWTPLFRNEPGSQPLAALPNPQQPNLGAHWLLSIQRCVWL